MGHPKIEYFSLNFALGVALGSSWRTEGAQSAPRQLQMSIFQEFCTILGSISEGILKIFINFFPANSYLISHRVFYFRQYCNNAVSICSSNSQFLARWRLVARSALDIRRPRVAGGRACVDRVSKSINF